VAYYCSRVPIILVGLKKDLRDDSKTIEELHKISQKPITYEQVIA
jgi:Ras family protein A